MSEGAWRARPLVVPQNSTRNVDEKQLQLVVAAAAAAVAAATAASTNNFGGLKMKLRENFRTQRQWQLFEEISQQAGRQAVAVALGHFYCGFCGSWHAQLAQLVPPVAT